MEKIDAMNPQESIHYSHHHIMTDQVPSNTESTMSQRTLHLLLDPKLVEQFGDHIYNCVHLLSTINLLQRFRLYGENYELKTHVTIEDLVDQGPNDIICTITTVDLSPEEQYVVLLVEKNGDLRSYTSTQISSPLKDMILTYTRDCLIQFIMDSNVKIYPNYPREGVMFKDVTTIFMDPKLTDTFMESFSDSVMSALKGTKVDIVIGLESRGFLFTSLAQKLGAGFKTLRKLRKVPHTPSDKIISESYSTEYSDDEFGMVYDESLVGKNVLIVDDLLATGGSLGGAIKVVKNAGMNVVGCATAFDVEDLRKVAYSKDVEVDCKFITFVRDNLEVEQLKDLPRFV